MSSCCHNMKIWPFKVVKHNGHLTVQVQFQGELQHFTPQQISTMILRSLKEMVEMYLGMTVNHVLTSMTFNDMQPRRQGVIVGLSGLHIINELTAAAIAYGMDKINSEW
ncbi:hypothetical protein FRC11_009259 [Ceratobasidium sp. 423]|nr:hypothetical protein FRC11_009259 [Ceratobasidium sp. 423]